MGLDSSAEQGQPRVPDTDLAYLRSAAELGRGGWGRVHPNPMVGCVLVRDGRVVGRGWHRAVGGRHAEIHALEDAGGLARGATAYVSLEPCGHVGRTPPCSTALAEAGVARVVFGAADPGAGRGGAEQLRRRGVPVDGPVFSALESRAWNPAFFHATAHDTPFVALKLAMTLDGRLGRPGERTAITGDEARDHAHWLRAGFAGIMIGSNTARVDDPALTVRGRQAPPQPPARIVLDSEAALAPDSTMVRGAAEAPVVVFSALDARDGGGEALEARGVRVRRVPRAGRGLHLGAIMTACAELDLSTILCEGGGALASSLLREGLVGRIYLYVAPWLLGDEGVPAFPGAFAEAGARWRPAEAPRALGDDVLLVLDPA